MLEFVFYFILFIILLCWPLISFYVKNKIKAKIFVNEFKKTNKKVNK